jgi:hypothetical protein
MVTWLTSARNMFRSPSGATNEAPDGPGAFQALRDDVDNYLGVGGAEYCANAAAVAAIPSGRKFLGKLVYRADTDTTYRYVGAGNTAIGANAPTATWQAWHRPPKAWNPTVTGYTGAVTIVGNSQIVAGRMFLDLALAAGPAFALTNAELAVTLGANEAVAGQMTHGSGFYQPANGSGSGVLVPLAFYTAGAATGALATSARIRVPRVNTATSPQNVVLVFPFTAFGAGTTSDFFAVSLDAPSALIG